jgi:hypothetical protein
MSPSVLATFEMNVERKVKGFEIFGRTLTPNPQDQVRFVGRNSFIAHCKPRKSIVNKINKSTTCTKKYGNVA